MVIRRGTGMLFVGSPNSKSLTELGRSHIFLSDMPLHDVTRELTLLNQQRLAEVELRYGRVLGGCSELTYLAF